MKSPFIRRARVGNPGVFPLLTEEHAAAIGYVAIRWAEVEGVIGYILGSLLSLQTHTADALSAGVSFLHQLNLISVCIDLTGSSKWIKEWQIITKKMDLLRNERNDAIHAEWEMVGADPYSTRRKARNSLKITFQNVPTETLNELSNKICLLADELIRFSHVILTEENRLFLSAPNLLTRPHLPGKDSAQNPNLVRPAPTLSHTRVRRPSSAQKRAATNVSSKEDT